MTGLETPNTGETALPSLAAPAGSAFRLHVQCEIERARNLHAPIHSLHEGYAVLLEEIDELWHSVRASKTNHQGDLDAYKELVQIGAMAQRIAEDVIDTPNSRI